MKVKSFIFASAAAAMFVAGGAGIAAADHHESDAKVKCEGVNSCKGNSACKTAENECAGNNSCKGKGFLMLTDADCHDAKDKE